MAEFTTIARPYAKAAFDFAVEKNDVDQWLEMITFIGQVASNDAVVSMLKATTAAQEAADLMIKLGGEQLNENGQNFIKVLAQNERLLVLPEVAVLFAEYHNDYNKQVDAEVTSATKLNKTQRAELAASLEKRLARKVQLNVSIDKSLVAGVIIRVGDLLIDGSVRGKLERLGNQLQS
ncbi:F0F1 ATP synthase subunit delta [Psychrobium sp. 1_MG-2023]|uniref:F0F1 ATP synthase subunit delta n=1 Tax=Psychrobium sp. 1_MG-2023 TaxID=3062624 RepID=UPI000C328F32|nr:F0F1 ATP synthase subunit delta [Psychrobium sp. 1_MG-2023]MDP2560452.1 F0F1 ATP synthase subunit delta [Psychrobium sp. 1_MG-2023]PKF57888.1 F0F1 ATP synthase subunit delta [Alteromonadales bacterium alter-6D02]